MDDEPVADFAVPFSMKTEFESVRLIELPPTILDEVTKSGNSLSLKSVTGDSGGIALVCTANETFEVRQMQSSNLLLLAETHKDEQSGEPSIRAFAEPKGMLELSLKASDIQSWLSKSLPVCELDTETGEAIRAEKAVSKSKVSHMRSAPCSDGEFEQAWKNVCAFEWDGVSMTPSPGLLVKTWKLINASALLRGVDLCGSSIPADTFDSAADEDGIPRGATQAVLTRISSQEANLLTLQQSILVPWLGEMILKGQPNQAFEKGAFLKQWHDMLPEKMHSSADLKSLDGKIELSNDSMVAWRQGPPNVKPKKAVSKWHEKLKASRK